MEIEIREFFSVGGYIVYCIEVENNRDFFLYKVESRNDIIDSFLKFK